MTTIPARVVGAAKLADIRGAELSRALWHYRQMGPLSGMALPVNPVERWDKLVAYYGTSTARIAELHYGEMLIAALSPKVEDRPSRVRRAIEYVRGKRA